MAQVNAGQVKGNALVLATAAHFISSLVLEVAGEEVSTSINGVSAKREMIEAMVLRKIHTTLVDRANRH